MGKQWHRQLSPHALIQFVIPLFPQREGMVRNLAQAHQSQAVSSLAPQCGQLQQSPIIYIQIRLALCRGLPHSLVQSLRGAIFHVRILKRLSHVAQYLRSACTLAKHHPASKQAGL